MTDKSVMNYGPSYLKKYNSQKYDYITIQKITDSQKSEKIESLKHKKAGLAGSVTRNYALLVAAVVDDDLVAATGVESVVQSI